MKHSKYTMLLKKKEKKKVNYIIVSRWSSQYSLLGSTTATTAHSALSPATRNNN
jgi:hypothetical protein